MMSVTIDEIAQISVGILILIVVRSLAEFFRLYRSQTQTIDRAMLFYIQGSLAAAVVALAAFILLAFAMPHAVIGLTAVTIIALIIAKLRIVGTGLKPGDETDQ